MLNPNQENIDFVKQKGIYKTSRLTVRSFKLYADGALGSRGALLKKSYSDLEGHYGLGLTPNDSLKKYMQFALENNYQVNTHCIGDSANANILNMYGLFLKDLNDLRWRIEHAQIVDDVDFDLFRKYTVIPSVQPTHATSDRLWAGARIGEERMKNAYAYKKLYNQNKIIAFGSDFPVEGVNPLLGFYSAVVRKPAGSPEAYPFQIENAMSRQDALRAITYWAAMANFEENEKGTITIGKNADIVILDTDLMTCGDEEIYKAKVVSTFINGTRVFNYQNR
jgi:predicted amidohydrolase YtcJ